MPLTDEFIPSANLEKKEYLRDIAIYECPSCSLVQNPVNFDHEDYYRDYRYSSGHSRFAKKFMHRYAEVVCNAYNDLNHQYPKAIIEIGSGDGEQLRQFKRLTVCNVLGIEPSRYLAQVADESGIPTQVDLFGAHTKDKLADKFDVCISSYTLDHVRSPIEYLQTAYSILNDQGGILAFEIHNLDKIVERTEYCLFEHEHTIYLTPSDAVRLISSQGFEVVAIDPLGNDEVRGNSLLVIAQKIPANIRSYSMKTVSSHRGLSNLDARIRRTITRLDAWIASLPNGVDLVGFGAGGRGVMTLAALKTFGRFRALFDSNFKSNCFFTPKTRIPVMGSDDWRQFAGGYCIVFSFGYLDEIKAQLIESGFNSNNIVSLLDFFPVAESN